MSYLLGALTRIKKRNGSHLLSGFTPHLITNPIKMFCATMEIVFILLLDARQYLG